MSRFQKTPFRITRASRRPQTQVHTASDAYQTSADCDRADADRVRQHMGKHVRLGEHPVYAFADLRSDDAGPYHVTVVAATAGQHHQSVLDQGKCPFGGASLCAQRSTFEPSTAAEA
jgi:hypothetical protein